MSNPAVIFGRSLLPSIESRSSSLGLLEPVNLCRPKGYCAGDRPSHLIFRQFQGEVVRILGILGSSLPARFGVDWRRWCSIMGVAIAMEVIGAGFGRTGTLSLKAALERLGFAPCYHMVEVPRRGHGPFWREAMRRKARREPVDWGAAFAGYRATVDFPAANFYAELAEAYPKAKVVLTVRNPQRWYESASKAFGSVPTIDPSTACGYLVSQVMGLLVPKLWGAT